MVFIKPSLGVFLIFALAVCNSGCVNSLNTIIIEEDPAVTNFREYLRINSAHPKPDHEGCRVWLRGQAQEIGLDFHEVKFGEPEEAFAIWLTWNGSEPNLKSILVNSHLDVVAADPEKWTHDPFEAYKDEDGNIFARGTIDMKSATVGTLEAIRRLKAAGYQPIRTVHVSVLPDEEIASLYGMKAFVLTREFRNLNVGFDIDEGTPTGTNEIGVSYGEKSIWQFNYTARGMAAHASTLPEVTAGQKLQIVIDKLLDYRASQLELIENSNVTVEDVTSLNLVRLGGGLGSNIIPDELWASFDMRIRLKPDWTFDDVEKMLDDIAAEAGPDVSYKFLNKNMIGDETPPNDSNIWWVELQRACREMNVTCFPTRMSGSTDGKYVRSLGIPVFGVSPLVNSENLAHQDNEFINEKEFLDAIDRYAILIRTMSSVSGNSHP